jgi:hypothetical protein
MDAAGNPLTSPGLPMQFALYAEGTSPARKVWASAVCAVPVERGYYTVVLGAIGCGGPTPLTTVEIPAGEPRWLEVTAGGIALHPMRCSHVRRR